MPTANIFIAEIFAQIYEEKPKVPNDWWVFFARGVRIQKEGGRLRSFCCSMSFILPMAMISSCRSSFLMMTMGCPALFFPQLLVMMVQIWETCSSKALRSLALFLNADR